MCFSFEVKAHGRMDRQADEWTDERMEVRVHGEARTLLICECRRLTYKFVCLLCICFVPLIISDVFTGTLCKVKEDYGACLFVAACVRACVYMIKHCFEDFHI